MKTIICLYDSSAVQYKIWKQFSQPHITPEGLMSASTAATSNENGIRDSPDRSVEDLQHKQFCNDLSRQNYYLQ